MNDGILSGNLCQETISFVLSNPSEKLGQPQGKGDMKLYGLFLHPELLSERPNL
jgi:hypothetical protein